jgi:hypothetical protein
VGVRKRWLKVWAEQAEVQPDRCRSWATIQGKGDRALGQVRLIVQGVGGEEDLGAGLLTWWESTTFMLLLTLFFENDITSGGGIAQLAASNGNGMLAGAQPITRGWR